ncbi:MAG: hypothetical protein ACPL3B_00545 [Fervidobacterium sp.]
MSLLSKITVIFLLVLTILLISTFSKRSVTFDYTLENTDALNETASFPAKTDISATVTNMEPHSYSFEVTQDTPINLSNIETPTQSATTEETTTTVVTLFHTEQETISVNTYDSIYNEMQYVERAARRYISAGYRISTLNEENMYQKDYLSEQLYSRYSVSFQASNDGYDIIIRPKFEINTLDKEKLLKKRNMRLEGGSVEYVFWIKAYK